MRVYVLMERACDVEALMIFKVQWIFTILALVLGRTKATLTVLVTLETLIKGIIEVMVRDTGGTNS